LFARATKKGEKKKHSTLGFMMANYLKGIFFSFSTASRY
jgi:hypothetical protein